MDRFIELVKKKIAGDQMQAEQDEFDLLLEGNADLNRIYSIVFSKKLRNNQYDFLEAEKAYAVHFVNMQLQNRFD